MLKHNIEQEDIRYIKGIGPRRAVLLNDLGVKTPPDLLRYFPYRYQDRRNFKKIKDLKAGEFSVVRGVVRSRHLKKFPPFLRRKVRVKSIYEVILEDTSGAVKCTWFNQAYLSDVIKPKNNLIIYGKPRQTSSGLQIIPDEYEVIDRIEPLGMGK